MTRSNRAEERRKRYSGGVVRGDHRIPDRDAFHAFGAPEGTIQGLIDAHPR